MRVAYIPAPGKSQLETVHTYWTGLTRGGGHSRGGSQREKGEKTTKVSMWPRNLLVLGLTALVIGAGEVRGQWEQDTQTPDQPAPLEGENLDFWDDAELPPIDEDPFSAEDDAFYDVPFDEDDYFYFEGNGSLRANQSLMPCFSLESLSTPQTTTWS